MSFDDFGGGSLRGGTLSLTASSEYGWMVWGGLDK